MKIPNRLMFIILALGSVGYCFIGNSYDIYIFMLLGLAVMVGVGLNILLGLSGQVSLGHVGFYAIGAYVSAILTTTAALSFWVALPLAALLSGVIGALLSLTAVRVSGAYLAMVTIAFGFIVQNLAIEWHAVTGGSEGIMNIPAPSLFGHALNQQEVALLIVMLTIAAIIFFAHLASNPWGLAMKAVRDSEIAAASIGLSPVMVRTVAFTLSAVLTGIAGALFSPTTNYINPDSFSFFQSILFLLVVIIGGSGKVLGPLAGALIVVLLPQLLSGFAEYQVLIFGVLLLLVLWLTPEGAVGAIAQRLGLNDRRTVVDKVADITVFLASGATGEALNVQNLCMSFGGVAAVSEVAFTAPASKITSIIGPNGAGKTTILNLICGFYKPDQGIVSLGTGENLAGQPSHSTARNGIARTFQTTQLFNHMSVLDNMMIALKQGHLGPLVALKFKSSAENERREIAAALLLFAGYRESLDVLAGTLSHVDKRLVEIARALATQPKLLMLDEPVAGLGAEDTERLGLLLRNIAQAGITVVLIEHDMKLIMSISDHIVVVDAGMCIASGTPVAIRQNQAVLKAYLGEKGLEGSPRHIGWKGKQDTLLAIEQLSAGYGAVSVLKDIDLTVHSGEMVAVLGANGAGKSTLMQAVCGLLRPANGQILFMGQEISKMEAHKIASMGLVLVPEGRQVFPELSVVDNIRLGAYTRHAPELTKEVELMLARFPSLQHRSRSAAGLLSGGQQQMLAIARGLMAKPKVLLLDEPSLGLSPMMINELYATLAQLRDEGMTILLVDQMAALALSIADRGYVIQSGRIVHHGTAEEIRNDPALEQAYLGKGKDDRTETDDREILPKRKAMSMSRSLR